MPVETNRRSITLSCHTIGIRKRAETEKLQLGRFDGQTDLFDRMLRRLEEMKAAPVRDDDVQSVFRIDKVEAARDRRVIYFVAETGDFGFDAELVDVDQSYASVYKRKPAHAELIPLFGMLYLPADRKEGVAILQRFGVRGMIHPFSGAVRSFLDDGFGDYHIDIDSIVPREVVQSLSQGHLKRIQLIARRVPADVVEFLRLPQGTDDIGEYVIEVKAKRNGFLDRPDWLATAIDGRTTAYVMPEAISSKFAEARIKVKLNGKERTVNIADMEALRPYVDVSEDVARERGGHPKYASIKQEADALLAELRVELGHEVRNEL